MLKLYYTYRIEYCGHLTNELEAFSVWLLDVVFEKIDQPANGTQVLLAAWGKREEKKGRFITFRVERAVNLRIGYIPYTKARIVLQLHALNRNGPRSQYWPECYRINQMHIWYLILYTYNRNYYRCAHKNESYCVPSYNRTYSLVLTTRNVEVVMYFLSHVQDEFKILSTQLRRTIQDYKNIQYQRGENKPMVTRSIAMLLFSLLVIALRGIFSYCTNWSWQ